MRPTDEEPIIVVSGLPRSGTSLVMQMLEAAEVPLLVDDARAPDESNPRGYYELAAVKRIREETGFLDGAGGRAVKIVAPLLRWLPPDRRYRVILLARDVEAVLRSQSAMLARQGSPVPQGSGRALRTAFEHSYRSASAWLAAAPGVAVLELEHAALIEAPAVAASRILDFLERPSPERMRAMAARVDPALRRAG